MQALLAGKPLQSDNEILLESSFLYCLTVRSFVKESILTVYYKYPEEALISIYHRRIQNWLAENKGHYEVYLNTFYVRKTTEAKVPNKNMDIQAVVYMDEENLAQKIFENCQQSQTEVIIVNVNPFISKSTIIENIKNYRPKSSVSDRQINHISGIIRGYIFCQTSNLVHVESDLIDISQLNGLILDTLWPTHEPTPKNNLALKSFTNNISDELRLKRTYQILQRVLIDDPVLIYFPIDTTEKFMNMSRISNALLTSDTSMLVKRTQDINQIDSTQNSISQLPKDVVRLLGLNMTLESLGRLCQSSKYYNDFLCANELFWREKVRIDYTETTELDLTGAINPDNKLTWKDYYKRLDEIYNSDKYMILYYKLTQDNDRRIPEVKNIHRIYLKFQSTIKNETKDYSKEADPSKVSGFVKIKAKLPPNAALKPTGDIFKFFNPRPYQEGPTYNVNLVMIEGYPESACYVNYDNRNIDIFESYILPMQEFLDGKTWTIIKYKEVKSDWGRDYAPVLKEYKGGQKFIKRLNLFRRNRLTNVIINGRLEKIVSVGLTN